MCEIIIAAVISFGVGILTTLYAEHKQYLAARSMRGQLEISKCPHPIDNSARYFTIYLTSGCGNLWCQLLQKLHIPVRLRVSAGIRWIPSDDIHSVGFISWVYPVTVNRRVLEGDSYFDIVPSSTMELAVAKTDGFNVYALGGFGQGVHFIGDYNLNLDIVTIENEHLPKLTLENYIQNGRVT